MVNTKDYTTDGTDYLKVDTVKKSKSKIATILPGSGWNDFNNKDEKTGEMKVETKPYITIDLDGEIYEWTLNMRTNEQLIEDFGSSDTDDWIGEQVKLMTAKSGNVDYITATGLPSNE